MKNEALRLFLAITALILTGLLTNPLGSLSANESLTSNIKTTEQKQPAHKKKAQENRAKAARIFAFYFHR